MIVPKDKMTIPIMSYSSGEEGAGDGEDDGMGDDDDADFDEMNS